MIANPTMPAGQLHVLLWHYFTPSAYPNPTGCHEEFVANLIGQGLIDYVPSRAKFEDSEMELTERGRVYIEAILTIPLPVMKWVMAA